VAALFVSDLHISAERPELAEAFLAFLHGPAPEASSLYVLGDLFDAWVGDDDLDRPDWQPVISALRELSDSGVEIAIQHGNRDFLLGREFAARCGARLMPEVELAQIEGHPALLLHGDQLCTDDRAYLAWRKEARSPQWQARFLALPLEERRRLAADLRATSTLEKSAKPVAITDVSEGTVVAALRAANCTRMIHGHTHRPAKHELMVDEHECERWVLPDWRLPGGYLRCEKDTARLIPWPPNAGG